jgi:hypothetical protein
MAAQAALGRFLQQAGITHNQAAAKARQRSG